jgi:hypothetical protein
MNDAISTIGLGVDTKPGLEHLKELRAAFAGLKADVNDLNNLRASADGLVGGAGNASAKLTTLSAELKAAKAQLAEMQALAQNASRTEVSTAQSTAQAVITASGGKLRAVVEDEKKAAEAVQRYEKEKTATVVEESKKRENLAKLNYSAKFGSASYSMGSVIPVDQAQGKIIQKMLEDQARIMETNAARRTAMDKAVEAEHRAGMLASAALDEATREKMLADHAAYQAKKIALDREAELRHQQMILESSVKDAAALQARLEETRRFMQAEANLQNKEAYARKLAEQDQEYKLHLLRQEEYAARHRELEATFRAAEVEANRLKLLAQNQQYQLHLMSQAEHLKEWKQIQALIANDEREAKRLKLLEQDQDYKLHLARQAEYQARHRELEATFRQADLDAQKANLLAQNQQYQLHLLAQSEALAKHKAAQRAMVQDANFTTAPLSSQVRTVGRAKALVDNGQADLARDVYGPAAVGAVGKLDAMIAQLNATQTQGHGIKSEAAKRQQHLTQSMNDAHSAARGLAGGLGQLWVTWGSTVPLIAGAAISGSMAKVFTAGKDVEFQLQFLKALSDDVKAPDINMDGFMTITQGSMSSVKEAAQGMRALAQAGLDQKSALAALPDVLDLAAIGEMKVGQAAITATGVVNAFGLSMTDIGRVGDVFARVAAASNTSVAAMTESMKQASTVGDMFGLTLEQASASIGVLAQRNILGTSAGTALTTALKNIYEPTAKAKAALDALNITTDDGKGGLKDYTQMMDELRLKLSQLNDSDKAVFLGTISDQRGAKALSAITKNYDEYLDFLGKTTEAQDFMSKGTLKLEDTVQGALQRMANTMDHTFVRGFEKAQPAIRGVLREMTAIAGDHSLEEWIARGAVGFTRLTATIVEHSGKILSLVGVYMGLKIVSSLTNAFVAYRTQVAMATLATAANTAGTQANTVALTMQERAAAMVGATAIRSAGFLRLMTAAAGPLSLVVMGLVTAYQLYNSETDEAANNHNRIMNTGETILDFYKRQTSKLQDLNRELERKNELERNPKGKGNDKTENQVAVENAQATLAEKRAALAKLPEKSYFGENGTWKMNSGAAKQYEWDRYAALKEVEAAEKRVNELLEQGKKIEIERGQYVKDKARAKVLTDRDRTAEQLEDLIDAAGGVKGDGGTEETRKMIPALQVMLEQTRANDKNYTQFMPFIEGLRSQINQLKPKMGDLKGDGDKGKNDIYRAAQAKLDGELQLAKDTEAGKLADTKSRLARNEIGDLTAIAQNLETVKAARKEELRIFKEKEELAARQENRRADQQQISNKGDQTKRADERSDKDANNQRLELLAKWSDDSLKVEADRLRKRGELVSAFQKEWDAKNGGELARITGDLDSDKVKPEDKEALRSRKSYLENQRETGTDTAKFEELSDAYDKLMSDMDEKLANVAQKASESNGFLSDVGAVQMADAIRDKTLPAAQQLQAEMAAVAERLGDNKLKANVSKMGVELAKEANRTKKEWIDAGKSIEKSLSDAFGKGGKAVGGLVSALMKQKAEQKDIDDQLKRAVKQDPKKEAELQAEAAQKTAQVQLSSYGEMASAAKSFFDENSKGYEAMQAAERVFRGFEMAMALESFLVKQGFMSAWLTAFTTTKTAEVAAETATLAPTVAVETAKQGVFSITALAGALALPFPANLPAFAVVAAMLAAIGIAVSGGGGGGSAPSVSEQRQKYQGTGYNYDPSTDPKDLPYDWELKKSESLTKALDALKDNSAIELRYSSSQLMALESIKAGISGMAASITQAAGLRGTRADERALGVYDTHSKLGFSSSSTSLQDSGIVFYKTNLGYVMNGGGLGESYAQMQHKSKSFWGLSSDTDNYTVKDTLDPTLSRQMGLVVKDMYSSISNAAVEFGQDKATVDRRLGNMSLQQAGLSYISLKGLSQEDAQKELEAIFSNMGDQMARAIMPGLDAFEQAGEGYYGTVMRVSSSIESANYTMQKLGIAAADFNSVGNKSGDLAAEIVRTSLLNKELQTGYTTGIAKMMSTMSGSASEMAEAYTKLNDVRRTMKATGARNVDVTDSMVKGAGGLDNLSSGMETYLENFFEDSERNAVKASLLNDEFAKMGLTLPNSVKQFRALVEGIDRSTAAGQTMYGTLIGLAEEFADLADDLGAVNPAITKQRTETDKLITKTEEWLDTLTNARGLLNDINSALNDGNPVDQTKRIAELRSLLSSDTLNFDQQLEIAGELKDLVLEKYQVEKENAETLIDFGREMQGYVLSLKVGEKSPLTNKQKLEEANRQYQSTLADTKSEDKDTREQAQSELQGKADALLELARTYYASSQSYTEIFNKISGELDSAGAGSIKKGSVLEELAKGQTEALIDLRTLVSQIYDKADDGYNKSAQALNEHLVVLQGMYNGINLLTEMPALLRSLPAELAAKMALGANVDTSGPYNGGTVTMPPPVVGYYPGTTDGYYERENAYSKPSDLYSGIPMNLENELRWQNYRINGSHANGLDYVPFDGYVAELHRGERVLTASEVSRMDKANMSSTQSFSPAERDEMAKEIRELKEVVSTLVTAQDVNTVRMIQAMFASSKKNAEEVVEGTKTTAPTQKAKAV